MFPFRRVVTSVACLSAVTSSLALAASVGLPPRPMLMAPLAAPQNSAVFNNPLVDSQNRVIVDHILSLINGTPAGAEISVAMYAFKEDPVAAALGAAKDRGVRVRVVVDASYADSTAVAQLKSRLGTNVAATSYVKVCDAGRACVSGAAASVNPINHNKFYLFSSTGGAANVVVQSSANLTANNTQDYWNNAVTLVGNTGLYTAYRDYFGDLTRALHNDSNYYRATTSGDARVYFFPRAQEDTIAEVLSFVTCPGNSNGYGTDAGYTKIRISAFSFTREALASRLLGLADKKCYIEIVYNNMSAGSASLLQHDRIKLTRLSAADNLVHSKYLLIDGTYTDKKNTKWIFTGSHNLDDSSLRENDETLLRIQSDALHDAYRSNFVTMQKAG